MCIRDRRISVVETFQGKATDFTHTMGLANWGLTLGRQRLGLLTLHNSPLFLQNLKLGRLDSKTQQIDVVALDIIRDREHGVPRFNEFRRQYGLRQLTSFDDFMDPGVAPGSPDQLEQQATVPVSYTHLFPQRYGMSSRGIYMFLSLSQGAGWVTEWHDSIEVAN